MGEKKKKEKWKENLNCPAEGELVFKNVVFHKMPTSLKKDAFLLMDG